MRNLCYQSNERQASAQRTLFLIKNAVFLLQNKSQINSFLKDKNREI